MFSTPLFLFLLLITSPLTVIPSVSAPDHAKKHTNKPNPQNTSSQLATNMLPSEKEILIKVMETMSSDQPWRVSYPNPCSPGSLWQGLECKLGNDNHFHVIRLDFGAFPNPTCKPTATFPSQVFSLPYLQSLFFYRCFTHSTTTFSIPPQVLAPLQQLSLRSNPALIGSIPFSFSSLKSLQVLTLSQNKLNGQIPPGMFSLTSIVHLDLSYNTLSGPIPLQVGNLRNLVGLDLSYNALSGQIPVSIGQLALLQKLDLSSNLLVGTIPNSIQKLTSLNFIALSNNKLQGFPSGLTKLVNLQYYIMDDNPMSIPLPSEFGMLVKLQELRLANCGYLGIIPPSFCNLMNLTTLSLDNNRLTGEIPAGFTSLSHIYHLNLSRNYLEGAVPFNATFLRRLGRNLDLSGNPGLCLDTKDSQVFGLKSDLNACGNHKGYSFSLPNKKSKSHAVSHRPSHTLSIFGALATFVLHVALIIMV